MDVYVENMRIAKAGPSLRERAEHYIAGKHHLVVVSRLCHYREELEVELEPESWVILEAPVVRILADVCDALHFTPEEKAEVLGKDGQAGLTDFLESRCVPTIQLNER